MDSKTKRTFSLLLLLLFSKCHSQWGEDWVGRRCFTVWVYLRNQFWREKKMGELWGKCVFDYTDKSFLHVMLCFYFPFGERGLCWTLNSDSARNPWALQSLFCVFFFMNNFHMGAKERAWVCLFEHSLGSQRAIHIHTQWIRMGWSSELCRALVPSPLLRCTYNVKVWSDFFFFVKFYILSLL